MKNAYLKYSFNKGYKVDVISGQTPAVEGERHRLFMKRSYRAIGKMTTLIFKSIPSAPSRPIRLF
jgi:hypothetical protein